MRKTRPLNEVHFEFFGTNNEFYWPVILKAVTTLTKISLEGSTLSLSSLLNQKRRYLKKIPHFVSVPTNVCPFLICPGFTVEGSYLNKQYL